MIPDSSFNLAVGLVCRVRLVDLHLPLTCLTRELPTLEKSILLVFDAGIIAQPGGFSNNRFDNIAALGHDCADGR